jgi:hypothetical protein
MFKMFCVFAMETDPRCCQFVSEDGIEFRRVGHDLVYVAPGAVRLADDDLVVAVTGHPIGRLDTWVEYLGIRAFFTDDLPSAVAAANEVGDEMPPKAA